MWQITGDRWKVKSDRWHVIGDMWQLTHELSHYLFIYITFFWFFWHQCYLPHTSTESVSPVCGTFPYSNWFSRIVWHVLVFWWKIKTKHRPRKSKRVIFIITGCPWNISVFGCINWQFNFITLFYWGSTDGVVQKSYYLDIWHSIVKRPVSGPKGRFIVWLGSTKTIPHSDLAS